MRDPNVSELPTRIKLQGLQLGELKKLIKSDVSEMGEGANVQILQQLASPEKKNALFCGNPAETKMGGMNAVFKLRMRSIGTTTIVQEIHYS